MAVPIKDFEFTLDLTRRSVIPRMEFYSGSHNASTITISLTNNCETTNLTNTIIEILYDKPDKTQVINTNIESVPYVEIIDFTNGIVKITLTTQALTCKGRVKAQIKVIDGEDTSIYPEFTFTVGESIDDTNTIVSSNEMPLLEDLIGGYATAQRGLAYYDWTYTAPSDNITSFAITSSDFNPVKDQVDIYDRNGFMYPNINYTRNNSVVTLTDYTLNTGGFIFCRILKDVIKVQVKADGSMLTDGTVGKVKLTQDVQNEINKIGDFTTNGITENNLALAVKNDRASLADMSSKQGDITQLNTTDKSSVVNAVKEVKTQANTNTSDIANIKTDKISVSTFNASIASIGSGTPIPYAGSLLTLQADASADKTKFYVIMNASDTTYYKHKAYWNGTTWTDGGAYEKTVFNVGEIASQSNLYANFCNDFDINTPYNTDTTGVLTQENGNLKVTYGVQPSYAWTMLKCKAKRMCYKPLTNGATYVPIMIISSVTAIHALNMDSGSFLSLQNFAYASGNLISGSSATAASLGISCNYPADLNYFIFDTYEDDTDRIDLGYISTGGVYILLKQLSVSALSNARYGNSNYPAIATLGLISSMSRVMGGNPLAQVLLPFNNYNMYNVLHPNDLLKIKSRLTAIETTFGLKLLGKKIAILGDSITARAGASVWEQGIETLTGATVTRYGVSGTMIQGISANQSFISRYTSIPSDTDVIIVEGGTNDWGNNGNLGICNYTDDQNTLYGALNILFKGFQNSYPNAKVYICTPPQRNFSGTGTTTGMGLNGATTPWTFEDCQTAIKTMARYFGYEIIDFFANLGWNAVNVLSFTDDGLHPNATGYNRMVNYTVKCINSSMI